MLTEWRKRMGLSQVQAAERLCISRNALRQYEATGDVPGVVQLAAAALEHLPADSLPSLPPHPSPAAQRAE